MKIYVFIFVFIFHSVLHSALHAAYYDTLPKGVANFTYRFVKTEEITGSYSSTGSFKGYNVNANINADSIRGVSDAVDTYLDSLSAEDYNNFSFGTFQGKASSRVTVQGFGTGYGLTDKITFYGFIPYYSAVVDLQVERTAKGRSNVGGAIQLENLPDVDLRLIQSLFVNYYQYQPLGQWKASDFGDAEIGMMTQLMKIKGVGLLTNIGVVAPSGKEDNPDILQDIAFGDGQWDAFLEFGGGADLNETFSIDQWSRATYQFASNEDVRLPESSTFPVTSRKGKSRIKLGNKAQGNVQINMRIFDHWQLNALYSYEYTEKTKYSGQYPESDKILAQDTEKNSQTARLNLNFSTIGLYTQKRFFLPLDLNVAVQSVFAGKNTPKHERLDLEARFYF